MVDYGEVLKVYGPMAIGWAIAAYLMKFIMDRYEADIKSRTDLASALNGLAAAIKESSR